MIAVMARRVTRAERIDPTPETARKLRPDPIMALRVAGVIDGDQMLACEEIRGVWWVLQQGVFFGASKGGRVAALAVDANPMPWEQSERLWRDVWAPWVQVQRGRVGLVLDVIEGVRKLAGRAERPFLTALDDWNALRGR